jgi:hypothetical protein
MCSIYKRTPVIYLILSILLLAQFAYASNVHDPCATQGLPAKYPAAAARFIAFGDSGDGKGEQYKLAGEMEEVRKLTDFRMALMLGDNLYRHGSLDVAKAAFEKPYADLLKAKVEFHPVLGNHDVHTHRGRDEINYFHMSGPWYSFRQGPAEFFMLDSNRRDMELNQISWVEKALSTSSAIWKIVATHHPIYSSGQHGPAWWLKGRLEPILITNHVNMFLSGHDHDYERIQPQNGVQYFVSGGGGGNVREIKKQQPYSALAVSVPHFLLFQLEQQKGWFQAINSCGRVFDSGVLTAQTQQ